MQSIFRSTEKMNKNIIICLTLVSIFITNRVILYSQNTKLESVLQQLIEKNKQFGHKEIFKFGQTNNLDISADNKITVVLELDKNKQIDYNKLKNFNTEIKRVYNNLVKIKVPVDQLENIGNTLSEINYIRLPHRPYPTVISEGVTLTGANIYQNDGYRGQNIKVAIIDMGFQNLTNAQNNLELSTNVVTFDYTGTGIEATTNHGTACAEIVYDMAPNVTLYLMKIADDVDLGAAKDQCISAGVKVISHSMAWFNTGPGDGTGPICEIANDARSHGIIWVNSAGNSAQSHWEGVWTDSTTDNWLDFTPSENSNKINYTDTSVPITVLMRWNDTWTRSNQDYDLYLYDNNGTEVASSKNRQNGTVSAPPPVEKIQYSPGTTGIYQVKVHKYNANGTHKIELFCPAQNQYFSIQVSESSIAEPADSTGTITVGAINKTYWETGPQESFSSQGPTNDGRIKPDLSAPDGVSNFTYGGFYGTSASAPHVAGAVALIYSRNPSYTPTNVEQKLFNDADDLGAFGKDNIFGYGKLAVKLNPAVVTEMYCEHKTNPVNLIVSQPVFSWKYSDSDPNDNQTAYQIIVSSDFSKISSDIGDKWDSGKIISQSSWTIYSGTPLWHTTYYWKLRLWDNFNSTGSYSNIQSFHLLDVSSPSAITDLVAEPGPAEPEITLSWTAPGDDGTAGISAFYIIKCSTITNISNDVEFDSAKLLSDFCLSPVPEPFSAGIKHHFVLTGLKLYTTYYFAIRAYDSAGNRNSWSRSGGINQNNFSVALDTNPAVPTGFNVIADDTLVHIFWNQNTETDIKGYEIQRSTYSLSEGFDILTNILFPGTTYQDTGLINGNTYYYRIRAFDNGNHYSDFSSVKECVPNVPPPPSITVISPNGGENWGINTTQTVLWASQGVVLNLNIDLSTNNGTDWITLVSNTINDGNEPVVVPNTPSQKCLIRIQEPDGSPYDISDTSFTISEPYIGPILSVSETIIDFGELEPTEIRTKTFNIVNIGTGTLSGNITVTRGAWLTVEPNTFSSSTTVTVKVTVDAAVLNKVIGSYLGLINITSNGGNTEIKIIVTALCVLVKPNPYNPEKGPLTFFGSGIVPRETTIKIYTLSGELVKEITAPHVLAMTTNNELTWDGRNDEGKPVTSGIYLYTYYSPKEKGIGKFTVIIK